ncbi:MAG: PAS domain S-box protein [Candidatus Manganitrophus sp.]|nr:PAS domain S-box protein [Candidatus Manganitrophus sp.]WDT70667.1 MAG: PAS domain S-box protein [Candidatus Manganitrophus sp.]
MEEGILFRLAFDQASVGMVVLAMEPLGQFIQVNPAFCRMTGYSREELLARDFQSITAPQDLEKNLKGIRSLLEQPIPSLQIEKRYIRKDGRPFWVRLNASLLRDDRARPTCIVVEVEDIETHKKTEEALRETDQTLRPLIQASPLAIVTIDLDLNVKMWNPAAERLFGWRTEEILGRPLPIIPREKQEEFQLYVDRLVGDGPTFVNAPKRRVRKDGTVIDVRVSTALLRNADGKVNGIMGIFTDITEEKRLEAELRHAQKLEGIGQLAGGIAHEFNNLLTAIIGNIELALGETVSGSRLQATLSRVDQAAQRAAVLTQQLLTFSRRSRIDLKPLHLQVVAEEVVCLLGQTFDRRIRLRVESVEGVWPVFADAGQMNQILMNLCVNARDALLERLEEMENSREPADWEPRIVIGIENAPCDEDFFRAHPKVKPGEYVCLSVSDNGTGIDEAIRHRIFEPFFTTKEVGRGTGLGLAAVYGIIRQHLGWIELQTVKSEGTVFKIYLPAGQNAQVLDQQAGRPKRVAGGDETILFIDDEVAIRQLAKTVLEQYGYRVLLAGDGVEAVGIFQREIDRVHLVILDLMMPRRSGEEVFRELRALAPGVKILISSGHPPAGGDLSTLGGPAAGFISKPYHPDDLARKVRALLDRSGGKGPSSH